MQADALFRAAADQAPQVMWIVNSKGAVTYLNQAWYELVGGMPPKWYGHEWGEVTHPEDLAEMRKRWDDVRATGTTFEGKRRVKASDGSWHVLAYRATPVIDAGGLACWVGMDADITEMVATQAALREANEDLQSFSHTVFHDLKAPLVSMQGLTHGLMTTLEGHADARVGNYLRRIANSTERMGNLLDGLAVLARVSRMEVALETVDLTRMAEEILDALGRGDPQREVVRSVQPGLTATADPHLMAVLMENLLANAWKFTSRQAGARIEVGMASSTRSERVYFVKDNGAGFDADHASRLFCTFQRFHSQAEFAGSGIGLSSVRKAVSLHGGRVWAKSAPGAGACFYFALPTVEMGAAAG
jgi:PAS domain S-box-containing protein